MSPHTDNMVGFCPGLRKALLQETGGESDFGIVSLVYSKRILLMRLKRCFDVHLSH